MAFTYPSAGQFTIEKPGRDSHPYRKFHRRASSADAASQPARSIFTSTPTRSSQDRSPMGKKKKPRHHNDSEVDASGSWGLFVEPAVNRDHLGLRPSRQQHDFIIRREGYQGFYHNTAFNTGVESYGYPDRELPAFLDGQMPDRMSHEEWQALKRAERAASPKRDRRAGRRRRD